MDATSNWAKRWCIFRNSSLSCWIFFLFFLSHQKSSTISSASETVLQVFSWCCRQGSVVSMRPALQPLQHPGVCAPCSTALTACWAWAAAPLQPLVSLGPGCSSPHCRPRQAGELSSEHTLSPFHPEEPWGTPLWAFVLGRVQLLRCAQKECWDALSGAFSLSSNHSESCGELGWGSDIRPLNLQYVGVSAVVVTWQGHS